MDAYEIQVYDGTADQAGQGGLELHANRDPHIQETHLTLEPSYGVTRAWEIGGYLQTAFLADGSFVYSGAKLRSKLVTTADAARQVRIGVNLELSLVPARVEPDRWGGEVRPILAWDTDLLLLAANPILGVGGDGPTFEPAAMAKLKIGGAVAIGPEYYGDLGPILKGGVPWREQQHYLFEAIDLLAVERFELTFGFGEGIGPNSHPFIGRVIVGYEL
jgi:hypothetical protein